MLGYINESPSLGDTIKNSPYSVIVDHNSSYDPGNEYYNISYNIKVALENEVGNIVNEMLSKPTSSQGTKHENNKLKKVIYDQNFSLVGKVVEKRYPTSGKFYYIMKGGVSTLSIPDNEGKYYQVNVTTNNNGSPDVELSYYCTYKYEYRKDKFSDFTNDSGELGENPDYKYSDDYESHIGYANEMTDINTTIYVRPMSESYFLRDIRKGLESRLNDRDLSLKISIPAPKVAEEEDAIKAYGHVTVTEVNKEEAGYFYKKIG